MNQRIDPLSGEKFIPKRSNQRFSCPENRIAYNNHIARELRQKKAPVDRAISKNYRVLRSLFESKEGPVFHKERLIGHGYNFSLVTNYSEYEGKYYPSVYEFLLVNIDTNKIKIAKK